MSLGKAAGHLLKVDSEQLSELGNKLLTAARGLPEKPDPFTVTGADQISLAIMGKLPAVEDVIQEVLPQVKTGAQNTASKIVLAAEKYLGTDSQLAASYEKHQFDVAASPSAAGAGGSPASASGAANPAAPQSDLMSQTTTMPMQMASRAAQLPGQLMSAAAAVPQGLVQGVQQFGQMGGGLGGDDGKAGDDSPPERGDDPKKDGAAAGLAQDERAPDVATTGQPHDGDSSATPAAADGVNL